RRLEKSVRTVGPQAQGEGMTAAEIDNARAPPRPARRPLRRARRCRGRQPALRSRHGRRVLPLAGLPQAGPPQWVGEEGVEAVVVLAIDAGITHAGTLHA